MGENPLGFERVMAQRRKHSGCHYHSCADFDEELESTTCPEMHATRKGKQMYFGMKAHIGVDTASGLVHHVLGTAAHVSDVTVAHHLLQGGEQEVHAEAGYQGVMKRA